MKTSFIKNKSELASHGNRKLRKVAFSILEYALNIANPYKSTQRILKVKTNKIKIDNISFNLSRIGNIYVLGAGKASLSIAKALEDLLDDKITDGIIVVKRGQKENLKRIRVFEAGHPVPDEDGLNATRQIVEIAKKAKENDIVICPLTGGCSSLLVLPAEDISLEDKRIVSKLLLNSGAPIQDINTVRRHISMIKGGRLAQYIHPATCITLSLKTIYDDMPWPDPTLPDPTTFNDAISILKRYNLMDKVPESVRKHLVRGVNDPTLETVKSFDNMKVYTFYVVDRIKVCEKIVDYARRLGFNSYILSTKIEGESRDAGIFFASIASEIEKFGRPFKPPCAIIVSGETTVTIGNEHGVGGPSQELALAAAIQLDKCKSRRTVITAIDTDGNDGVTDATGGIVDHSTVSRLKMLGIDANRELHNHNSYYALKNSGDLIITGFTGTNILDLNIILVG
ncbi:MAG: glycerate kinase [Nitrososphaeria archaeon]|nr:glycerate kinase [Nitrososphaeria archaeon]